MLPLPCLEAAAVSCRLNILPLRRVIEGPSCRAGFELIRREMLLFGPLIMAGGAPARTDWERGGIVCLYWFPIIAVLEVSTFIFDA